MLCGEIVTAGDFPELFINRVLSIPRPQVFAGMDSAEGPDSKGELLSSGTSCASATDLQITAFLSSPRLPAKSRNSLQRGVASPVMRGVNFERRDILQ